MPSSGFGGYLHTCVHVHTYAHKYKTHPLDIAVHSHFIPSEDLFPSQLSTSLSFGSCRESPSSIALGF